MCETLIMFQLPVEGLNLLVPRIFNGEENVALLAVFRLFTRASLLDHIIVITEVELTLSVFHLILYGDITETVNKEQVIFMDQNINLVMAYNHSSIKDCMITMFLVLCVTMPIRTLNSCYQQRTSVPLDGVEHIMDISWQNALVIMEETCTCVSTTTQSLQAVAATMTAICSIL